MEWLAFERFAATWKDYEAAYGYQEMFYWKMGRAGLCFMVKTSCQRFELQTVLQFEVSWGLGEVFLSILGRVYQRNVVSEFEASQRAEIARRDNLISLAACTASFCLPNSSSRTGRTS